MDCTNAAQSWTECSIACKTDKDDEAGEQERNVKCTLQDGTIF